MDILHLILDILLDFVFDNFAHLCIRCDAFLDSRVLLVRSSCFVRQKINNKHFKNCFVTTNILQGLSFAVLLCTSEMLA